MDKWRRDAKLGELRSSIQPILEYSQRELKDYTRHGFSHSEGVEKAITDIRARCQAAANGSRTNDLEDYILVCSAWLHDIGNILGRDGHNKTSCRIIDTLSPRYIEGLDRDCLEFIKWLCRYHSRKEEIMKVPVRRVHRGEVIRLRYLVAILRIADASDIDNRRAPIGVFEIIKKSLPKRSKDIWQSHQAIRDVSFLPEGDSIIVTVSDERKASWAIQDFRNEFDGVKDVLVSNDFPYQRIEVVTEDAAL